jgi:hypothetical protein
VVVTPKLYGYQPDGKPAPLVLEVEHGGRREVRVFDAGDDRRVIIGRGPNCDLPIDSALLSRKHAMLLCTGAGWQLHDLGSTNGIEHNGKRVSQPRLLEPGDVFGIGDVVRIYFVGGTVPERLANPAALVVDLVAGTATVDGHALPLSAAELIWFAWLAVNRASGEGWVVTGVEGHPALRAFAAALLERPWTEDVRTRPLLELARGAAVDDEDLKNLRGKTAQKLRAFCTGDRAWLAPLVVPELAGKSRQRLPLPAASLQVVGAP